MLTPSQYKKRYESIDVVLEEGTSATVAVNQYRLFGMNYNAKAASGFLNTLAKRGIDTDRGIACVDPRLTKHEDAVKKGQQDLVLSGASLRHDVLLVWGTRVGTRVTDWNKPARLVFVGKGSPEACQAVLQLANHWGLAPDVQTYTNSALGLECNGFVGNYLWHAQEGNR